MLGLELLDNLLRARPKVTVLPDAIAGLRESQLQRENTRALIATTKFAVSGNEGREAAHFLPLRKLAGKFFSLIFTLRLP